MSEKDLTLEQKVEVLVDLMTQQQKHIETLISDLRVLEKRIGVLARFGQANAKQILALGEHVGIRPVKGQQKTRGDLN